MTNADKFKSIFGLYATELWAKPEKDFLEWLNADVELFGNSEQLDDNIRRQAAIDARRYTFGNDEFSLEAAYHDCKLVFDGIVDDDSFQEADTGLILYYANEIIYALSEAIKAVSAQSEQPEIVRCKDCKYLLPKGSFCSKDMCGLRGMAHYHHVDIHNDFCSWAERQEE